MIASSPRSVLRVMSRGGGRALALWLVLAAIIVQVVPAIPPATAAGWRGDGLFAALCASPDDDGAPAGDDDCAGSGHCLMCRVPSGMALRAPDRLLLPAIAQPAPAVARLSPPLLSLPAGFTALPPLPSRGPPSIG